MPSPDTIVAIATAAGQGAVGIVRLSGPDAFSIAEKMAGPLPPASQASLRSIRDSDHQVCDQGLVLCFPAPNSFTGENVVEIQGHGGPVVLNMIVNAACAHGARQARPGEFSERAFLNDRIDLAQAEAIADLIEAGSEAAARAARRTLQGAFSTQIDALAQQFIELRVFVEGALDFSDEEIDWLSDAGLAEKLKAAEQTLNRILAQAAQGRRLREGITIAIAGRPNVGKSTLINQLSGVEAAIVSDIPGTTRDVLREHLMIKGMPVTVIDTAGLRDTQDLIESEGIRRAWSVISQAELNLFVADDREGVDSAENQRLLQQLPASPATLLVLNKCDLSGAPLGTMELKGYKALRLSAGNGQGLDALRDAICEFAGVSQSNEGVFSARSRHLEALKEAQRLLASADKQLKHHTGAELAAEDLRLAHDALGTISGRISSDDLLGEVFSRFCIGK